MTRQLAHLGSTYRLQLHGVGFAGARSLVGYLSDLGVETLYVSPVLAAVPGSTHGYDVIDPGRLDPSLGSDEDFESLLAELAEHGMRLLVDIVPNHMATHPSNRWWWDVLRAGPSSPHACVFDIDWPAQGGRVLVPTLDRPLEQLVDSAKIAVDGGERVLSIGGQRFPLAPGTPEAGEPWAVLERQHYRASEWRLGRYEGNYRRFFDIDGLIGVRVEEPDVFEETHRLLTTMAHDRRIVGWRVDHIDGLSDPGAYLTRLRAAAPPVVLVEKILARHERLPTGWPVDGTTGYEFAALAGGLFVTPEGARTFSRLGETMTGDAAPFDELALEGKRNVLARSFPAPLEQLTGLARGVLDASHPGHDLAHDDISEALAALTVHLEVYRTYLDGGDTRPIDRSRLIRAREAARADSGLAVGARRGISRITEGLLGGDSWLPVARRWQQLSAAVMAKGVEDTATYRYAGLLSHAEVGCDPDGAVTEPEEFHRLVRRHRHHPCTLNATSTHDSKRSEDVRARLFALSEVADEWAALVQRWHRRHRRAAALLGGRDELAAYQSLAGVWPYGRSTLPAETRRRVQDYMVKSVREAKRRSSWENPDSAYERCLTAFVGRLSRDEQFGREMGSLVGRIGPAAATNSLAMLVLKAIVPGVPDIYQGSELWQFALTDPDNRRPVDHGRLRSLLGALPETDGTPHAAQTLLSTWEDGRLKLFVTRALLQLRRNHPELFDGGSYRALEVLGARSHIIGVARRWRHDWIVAVVPRQVMHRAGARRFAVGERVWSGTEICLPAGAPEKFADVFTGTPVQARGGALRVADCLSALPVSVLAGSA